MTSPFVVNVADLVHRPGARRAVRVTGRTEGLQVTSSRVPPPGDVELDLVLESVLGGIVASGTVTATWEGECRRCLVTVTGPLRAEVRELFTQRPEDETTYPLVNAQVDLEPLAREAALLELPAAPLCADECRGLCPACGADRNVGPCDCAGETGDPRWAALDSLDLA